MSPDEPSGWVAYECQKNLATAQHAAGAFLRSGSTTERENIPCDQNVDDGKRSPHKSRTMPTPSLTVAPVGTSDAAAPPVATSTAPNTAAAPESTGEHTPHSDLCYFCLLSSLRF